MLIAVNTRFLIKDKLEGIGWFTYETMKRLTHNHPEHTFLFLFDREPDPEFVFGKNVKPIRVWPPARHPYLWKYWFDYALPSVFKRYKPDLFISTDGFLSLKSDIPTLLVVHDLGFEHYPEHVTGIASNFYRKYMPLYAKKATRIITVSEFSKKDIVKLYHVAPDKIDVAYNGANDKYIPISQNEQQAVRNRYTGGKPYFLYVGSVHPRKNVKNLLLAYDALRKEHLTEHQLVIAGRMAWKTDETKQVFEQMQFKNDVVFTNHLLLSELTKVMASADAFVYPSLFEGFGIPIVEARYCGVPIITSDRSSLTEVGGPNALYFDPDRVDLIKDAMKLFLLDRENYHAKAKKDVSVREVFNWDKTVSSIESAIASMDSNFVKPRQSVEVA
ncbi:MAG: glycosyltransferase family 4 protein [Bacteroidetes bacterium]|jgi:glycosyltransferase involved in cell wall biosynthesis|nr:glycosyltransferase family 4 protein [Bacteroidota bacterium]MBL0279785.1 glycosyltransferase family 4 protein [Bacteroidota bacterium]